MATNDRKELAVGLERAEAGLACVVELEKGNGARLRIGVCNPVAVDWGQLKEAFLEA
jgi:hypothetical protein